MTAYQIRFSDEERAVLRFASMILHAAADHAASKTLARPEDYELEEFLGEKLSELVERAPARDEPETFVRAAEEER